MSRWFAFSLTLLMIGLSSCAPTKTITTDRSLGLDEVLARVRERNETIKTLTGDGTITVETPEASNSGSFNMRLKKPDSLCVELRGPFGIHVGTLMLSRNEFIFYNRMENVAVVGKPDGKTLNSIFRLRMRFDEILNAFTGEFSTPSSGDSLQQFSVENGFYLARYRSREGIKEYRIDGDAFTVANYRLLDSSNQAIINAFAAEITPGDEIAMPRLLRVVLPKERRSITISYDDVEFNDPVECSFALPKQAEVIHR